MNIPNQWTFETPEVAEAFERHVREQLPWYEIATAGVKTIARNYITKDGTVYDIGAATGNIGRALAPIIKDQNARFVPIEASVEMAKRYRGPGEVIVARAEEYPFDPFDLAVCFLVLMFLRPGDVPVLLDRLKRACRPGGAIIVVEKTLPMYGYAATVNARLTLQAKKDAGVMLAEIAEKELSLSGVQRPIDTLAFKNRDGWEWFRYGDFAGYVIEPKAAV